MGTPSRARLRRAGAAAVGVLITGFAPAVTALPAAAAPAAVTVDCSGADDSALQTALDGTAPGTEGGATTDIAISGVCTGAFMVPAGATLRLHGDGGGDDALDGGGEARPLTATDTTLTLADLAVQNGTGTTADSEFNGVGGGLLVVNSAGQRVVLDGVVFRDNGLEADAQIGIGGGAAVFSVDEGDLSANSVSPADFRAADVADAGVVVVDSTFGGAGDGNRLDSPNGFLSGLGGGLAVLTTEDVHVEGSTFEANRGTAGGGAAILPLSDSHIEVRNNLFRGNTLSSSEAPCSAERVGGGLLVGALFGVAGAAEAMSALELDAAPAAPAGIPTLTQVGNDFVDNVVEPAFEDSDACNTDALAVTPPEGADSVGEAAGGGEAIAGVWAASRDDRFVGNTIENGFGAGEAAVVGVAEGAGLAIEAAAAASTFYAENLVAAGNEITVGEGSGGGIYLGANVESTLHLVCSTVAGNAVVVGVAGAGIGGGIDEGSTDNVVLDNSIVAANTVTGSTGPTNEVDDVESLTATASDVCVVDEGVASAAPGAGNICADPKLADAAGGDVHQTASSPTVDAGSPALVPSDLTADYEGGPRVTGDRVDMGADERAPRPTVAPGSIGLDDGYCLAAEDGGMFTFGGCAFLGAAATGPIVAPQSKRLLNAPMVGLAMHPNDTGYWMAGADGGVFTFGSAGFFGSMGAKPLNSPIVGIASSPTGNGYYLVAADGGVFTFGDAAFLGSMGGKRLNAPIANIVVTPSGQGYWLVAADGGVFSFGDATFFGSMGGKRLNAPVIGMASRPGGLGYWLVATDGGIFSFGDAPFLGSMGAKPLNKPIMAMKSTSTGLGYFLVANDGGVFTFGDAPFLGSMGGTRLNQPIVDMAG